MITWQTEHTICLHVIRQYDGNSNITDRAGLLYPHSVENTKSISSQKIGKGDSPRSASVFEHLAAANPA